METIKCKIVKVENEDVFNKYLSNWGYAFRKMYSDLFHGVNVNDKSYQKELQERCLINAAQMQSLVIQVKMTKDSYDTITTQIEKRLFDAEATQQKMEEDIAASGKSSGKDNVALGRISKKVDRLRTQIERRKQGSMTFGGNALLGRISYLSNLAKISSEDEWRRLAVRELRKNENGKRTLTEKDINERIALRRVELKELPHLKEEYSKKRTIHYYSVGNSGVIGGKNNCNPYFQLHLADKYVVFKPKKGIQCKIIFTSHDKTLQILDKVNYNKQAAITVSYDNEYIYFTYDTFKVYNDIPKFSTKDAVATRKAQDDKIKEIYASRSERYVGAVDLNPLEIGFALIKVKGDNTFDVVEAKNYNLGRIKLKKGVHSTDKRYKSAFKHLHTEIPLIAKNIVSTMNYYNARYFVMDNVTGLKAKGDIMMNKAINKMFHQQWLKDDIMYQLRKRCNECGIQVLESIPNAYSSIIGNFTYPFYDSVNAALEMARRGAITVKTDKKLDYQKYLRIDSNDKRNIAQFFIGHGRTQSDVPSADWKAFWQTLSKDLKNSYREKRKNSCCVKRGLGYKTITKIEKYNQKCVGNPIMKHFSEQGSV